MRVLLLSWEYPPVLVGGLGRHVHALSRALARAGDDVTVVTQHCADAPAEHTVDGVRIVRAAKSPMPVTTGSASLVSALALNHCLTRTALKSAPAGGYDVIHAHDWLVAHTAVTLKEHLDLPLVTTVHATETGRHQGWLPDEASRSIHAAERWLTAESARVVACSHYMRWELATHLGVPTSRIDVIANGVDPTEWRPCPSEVHTARQRYAGSGPLLGFAGRLVYEKGVQDLLAAVPQLRARHRGLRLVVAGSGPFRGELQQKTERMGLRDAVSFTGFLGRALPAVMAATDVMVVPSIYEPFGMIALEAAAVGVPVAASSTGGLKEIVEPGRTGARFTPADPPALARAVSRLLDDARSAEQTARRARHMVCDRYSWTDIAERTRRVYRSAGAAGPASPCPE